MSKLLRPKEQVTKADESDDDSDESQIRTDFKTALNVQEKTSPAKFL